MSSFVIFVTSFASFKISYIGTVPTGTLECSMIALLIASKSPSVLRSITVSAPNSRQISSFLSSAQMSLLRLELPIFALTFVFSFLPMPIGFKFL